jgi:hypothetical protein
LLDRLRRTQCALDACRGGRTIGRQGDGAYQAVSRQLVVRYRVGLAWIDGRAEKGGRVRTALAPPAARPGAPQARS